MALNDQWLNSTVICSGGLVLDQGRLFQGTELTGSARILQNMEPALEGGYQRLLGYDEYDADAVPGTGPVLGVKVALQGVFAARLSLDEGAVEIYYSSSSGWTQVTSSGQDPTATKYRGIAYSITTPVVVFCDGKGPAWKYDGSSDTLISGTGAPNDPKFVEMHLSRLVLSGYGAGSLVSLSAPNDDEDFDGSNGAIEVNVGDTVTGLCRFRETLYIFCRNSIFKLTGSTADDFAVVPVTRSIGCVSGDTIQEVGGDLVFLAPDGLRSIAATERIGDIELGLLSRQIQPIVRPIVEAGYSEDDYSSCPVRAKSQYRLFVYDDTIPRAQALGLLGKLEDAQGSYTYEWATLKGIQPYCADSEYLAGGDELVVFGDTGDGFVYQQEFGNSLNGENIEAIYRTPDYTFGQPLISNRKVYHKIRMNTEVRGDVAYQIFTELDYDEDGVLQPPAIPVTSTGGSTWDNFLWDSGTWGGDVVPIVKKNLIGSGFTIAFEFTSDGTDAVYRIDSFDIQYSVKGRR